MQLTEAGDILKHTTINKTVIRICHDQKHTLQVSVMSAITINVHDFLYDHTGLCV